jgi:hypothetical protein
MRYPNTWHPQIIAKAWVRTHYRADRPPTPMDDQSAANRRPMLVAHTASYSNPEELQVRITRLAEAAGWAS